MDPRPAPVRPQGSAALDGARLVARLLDEAIAIPGTSFRIGLDPIIGLVPGIGDAIGALLSGWILLVGIRLGAPGAVVARMALNVGIDTLVGAIPIGGDLFDFAWKSNVRNVRLLEAWLARPAPTHRASGAAVAAVVAGMLAVVAAVLVAAGWALVWAARALTS